MTFPADLTAYLAQHGDLLGAAAMAATKPLHVPGRDAVIEVPLLRKPFDAQSHMITANIRAIQHGEKSLLVSGALGTGKTICALAITHGHAEGRGYRAIVLCPPHLVGKWRREIITTVPGAYAQVVDSYRDMTRMRRSDKPVGAGWWVVSNSKAKLGPKWKPAVMERHGFAICPLCMEKQVRQDKQSGEQVDMLAEEFAESRMECCHCKTPLWQWTSELDRWPVAQYVHKRLKGYFDYSVIDEAHQGRGDSTAIGYALGSIVAATNYSILLSGTIIGGRASHVRSLTLRTSPQSLLAEGIGWKSETLFNERYGRLEKKMASKETRTADNKQSRGRRTTTLSKRVVPGVMPSLFRHLMARTTFLGLDEIADNLPLLNEEVIEVKMEKKLAAAYDETEEALSECVKMLLAQRNTKMLSKMLVTLIGYADHPFGWGDIGYDDEELGRWVHVVTPKEFSKDLQWAKEKALVAEALKEKAEGRKFWIYATMTGKRDVVGRLESQLTKAGLKIAVMRSTIPTNEREEWIAKMAPGVDGVISHPQLVETGIDFFDNRPRTYNIPTIMFAQCGYNLFTLRQAAGRHWRIGQDQECRTKYFFYEGTMQARAMALMGKKLSASLMIEGKFSSEGLAAMAGDEGSLEMAMARSLVEKLDDLDVGRAWGKITANPSGSPQETTQKKDGPVIQAAKPAYRVADLLAGFNSDAPESLQDASDDEGEESVAEVVREAPSVIPGVEVGSWWRVRGSQSLPVKVAEARGGLVSVCRAGTRTPLPAIPATQFLAQFSPVR